MASIAFLGTGLLGGAFAEAAAKRGDTVTAWNRSPGKAVALAQFGITAHPLLVRGWAVVEPVLLLVLFLPGTPRASPTVGGDTVCSARRGFAADPGPAG